LREKHKLDVTNVYNVY